MAYNFLIGNKSNYSEDPSKKKQTYKESLRNKLTMDPKAMFLQTPPATMGYIPQTPKPVYPFNSITIGNQIWMAQDLDITSYYDNEEISNIGNISGDSIDGYVMQVYENSIGNTSLPSYWIWREFDIASKGYSKWYGTPVIRKLAINPFPGWRVPSVADWQQLISYLGGSSVAGGKLKGPDTANLWNQTGYTYISYDTPFNAVPSGVSTLTEGAANFIYMPSWDLSFTLGDFRATTVAAYWTSDAMPSFYYINHNSNSITYTTVANYPPNTIYSPIEYFGLLSIRLIRDI